MGVKERPESKEEILAGFSSGLLRNVFSVQVNQIEKLTQNRSMNQANGHKPG